MLALQIVIDNYITMFKNGTSNYGVITVTIVNGIHSCLFKIM